MKTNNNAIKYLNFTWRHLALRKKNKDLQKTKVPSWHEALNKKTLVIVIKNSDEEK